MSLSEEPIFIIKMIITPLYAYKRNWCALTSFKNFIAYHNNNWDSDKTWFRKLY